MLNKEKTVIYLRVSTKMQEEDGYSLDVQESTSLKYARNNNLEIVRLWKCSESAWGKTERKVFNKMIELVKTRKDIKHIIFYSPDRMTRNIKDNETIKELREEYGKVIHFCQTGEKEEGKLTSSNEMMSDIRTSFNKFFSNFISEKTAPAMAQKASNGIYPSNTPIGYINNKLNKTIDVDISKAQLVKELFYKIASGNYSMRTLSDYLFKQGLRSKIYNRKISISSLYRIIKNPFYYGEFYWSGVLYKGTHEPLITKELWEKANEVLTGNRKPYITGQRFAFSRLLICEKCGCNILGEIHKEKYIYYRCSFSRGSHSHKKALRQEILIAKLKDIIPKIYISGKIYRWLKKVIKEINVQQESLINNKMTLLKNTLTTSKKELNFLYEKEFYDKDTTESKKAFYKEKEKSLMESIETSKKELIKCCLEKDNVIKEFKHIFKISKYYNLADDFEKANIIKLILNKSMLSKDNEIIPNYKTPFDIFANINK